MLLHSSKGHLKTPRSGSIAPSPFTQSILPDRNLRRQKKKPQKLFQAQQKNKNKPQTQQNVPLFPRAVRLIPKTKPEVISHSSPCSSSA